MFATKQSSSVRMKHWLVLSIVLGLQGCVTYSQKERFLQPTPVDFQAARETPPLYADNCRFARDTIVVPLGSGILLRLQAVRTIENAGRNEPSGTTISGEMYIPAGQALRFIGGTFTARVDTTSEERGVISEITRYIDYAPNPRAGVTLAELKLSPQENLKGWTAEEALVSGHIPKTSYVEGELYNLFRFVVRWEGLDAGQFVVRIPDLEINGQVTQGKTVSFKQVETDVFYNSLCS